MGLRSSLTARRYGARAVTVLAPLLFVATAVIAPGGLTAAPAPVAGFQVTPPRIEQDLKSRTFSLEVSFRNNTTSAASPTFGITGLGHDLDGQPLLPEPTPALSSLRLSATTARLAPGEATRVTVRGSLPADGSGLYAGVVASFPPPTAAGTGVNVTQRLASLVLLRGPRPWQEAVAVETVAARPSAEDASVEVFAQLRNTGNVHVRPAGKVKVIYKGKLLDTIDLKPEVVIPAYARRLGGPWRVPPDVDGPVRLEAMIDGPGSPATGTGTATFRDGKLVVPPGGVGPRAGSGGDKGSGTGSGRDTGSSLDNESKKSGTGRVILSVLGGLVLLALVIILLLIAKRRRDEDDAN